MIAKRSITALTEAPGPDLEIQKLAIALDHWRKRLSPRLTPRDRYLLVLRHGLVLTGALEGFEVPSSEEIAGFPVPVGF